MDVKVSPDKITVSQPGPFCNNVSKLYRKLLNIDRIKVFFIDKTIFIMRGVKIDT